MWFRSYMCFLYDGRLDSWHSEISSSRYKLGYTAPCCYIWPFFLSSPNRLYLYSPSKEQLSIQHIHSHHLCTPHTIYPLLHSCSIDYLVNFEADSHAESLFTPPPALVLYYREIHSVQNLYHLCKYRQTIVDTEPVQKRAL